jgi:hypothetical protein
MPEYPGRGSDRTLTACTAGPCEVRHGSPASRAVRTQSALRPTSDFALAIPPINRRRSAGMRGRPRGLDFHRQHNPNPFRCHRTSVSGFTTRRSCPTQSSGTVRRVSAAWRYRLTSAESSARRTTPAACEEPDSRQRAGREAGTSTLRTARCRQGRGRLFACRGERELEPSAHATADVPIPDPARH